MKPYTLLLIFTSLQTYAITAQEPVISIATKIANQGAYVSDYNSEFKLIDPGNSLTWTVKNFNNNNSAWDNIRCGSKTTATTATITTDFAIAQPISKVDVELSRYKTGSTNRMTSMTLLISPNADMSNSTSYPADISDLPTTTGTPVTISIPITRPADNMFYRLSIEMPKVSSEGVFSVNSLQYYPEIPEPPVGEHDGTLNFTDKEAALEACISSNTIEPGSSYSESGTNNLNGIEFVVGDVRVTFSKADGTTTPRWWESATITPELRLNPDNVVTFETTKQSSRLVEVKFLQGNAATSYYDNLTATAVTNLGESTFADKTWTAPESGDVNNLTLTFSDYCRCGSIRITYFDQEEATNSIDTILMNPHDSDKPLEYYNLQGIRMNPGNLTPGIYILRQGSSTTKTLILPIHHHIN